MYQFGLIVHMALTPKQIASILRLRGLGWSQKEIAETLDVSQQVIAYHLKKLREKSRQTNPEDVFNNVLAGGLAGVAIITALAEIIKAFGGDEN